MKSGQPGHGSLCLACITLGRFERAWPPGREWKAPIRRCRAGATYVVSTRTNVRSTDAIARSRRNRKRPLGNPTQPRHRVNSATWRLPLIALPDTVDRARKSECL